MKIDLQYISKILLEMEDKYKLLQWKIEGVYVWQSARAQIYEKITNLLYSSNYKSVASKHKAPFNLFHLLKRAFINCSILNPYLDFNTTDNLIFESSRKELVDGEFIDIYTKYIIDCLEDSNETFTVYSIGKPLRKLRHSYYFNKSLDFVNLFSKSMTFFFNNDFNKKDEIIIHKIENEIKIQLSIEINLFTILKNEIKRFKSQYLSYKLLFIIKRPKNIFLVGSGYKAPLVKAAKDCDILVNELQHGLILKESIIANYPNSKENTVEYFPDRFYIWKDLNMCSAKLPLSKDNIFYFPNYHLEYMMKKFRNNVRKSNQITIISQPFIGNKIFKYLISNNEKMRDWHFIYKLHPSENIKDYELLDYKINELSNIEIITNETSIYKLMSESNIVIGVFSTALFEAKHFDCKIILLDIPGVEFAELLLNQKNVIKIKLSDDLYEKVLSLSS